LFVLVFVGVRRDAGSPSREESFLVQSLGALGATYDEINAL
jgi:hypothetical protein